MEIKRIMKGMFERQPAWLRLRHSVGEESEIKLERRVSQIVADLEHQAKEFIFYSVDNWGADIAYETSHKGVLRPKASSPLLHPSLPIDIGLRAKDFNLLSVLPPDPQLFQKRS